MTWLKPKAIFDGNHLLLDHAIELDNGVISQVLPVKQIPENSDVAISDTILTPGLFDIQINGGGGVMLNNCPTPEGVRAIAQAHRDVGTVFTLPTVITDTDEVMEKAALAVLSEFGKNGVLGIHIEGPHISFAHKGTHNPAFIRAFNQCTMSLLETLRV